MEEITLFMSFRLICRVLFTYMHSITQHTHSLAHALNRTIDLLLSDNKVARTLLGGSL